VSASSETDQKIVKAPLRPVLLKPSPKAAAQKNSFRAGFGYCRIVCFFHKAWGFNWFGSDRTCTTS